MGVYNISRFKIYDHNTTKDGGVSGNIVLYSSYIIHNLVCYILTQGVLWQIIDA